MIASASSECSFQKNKKYARCADSFIIIWMFISETSKNVLITLALYECQCRKNRTCVKCVDSFSTIWMFVYEKFVNKQNVLIASAASATFECLYWKNSKMC